MEEKLIQMTIEKENIVTINFKESRKKKMCKPWESHRRENLFYSGSVVIINKIDLYTIFTSINFFSFFSPKPMTNYP
jgi:hypothetical protein